MVKIATKISDKLYIYMLAVLLYLLDLKGPYYTRLQAFRAYCSMRVHRISLGDLLTLPAARYMLLVSLQSLCGKSRAYDLR